MYSETSLFQFDGCLQLRFKHDQLFKLILRFIGQRVRPPSFSYILMSGPLSLFSVSRSLDIALKAKIIHLRSRFAALDSCQMSVGQMVKFSLFLSNSIIAWRAKSRSLSGNSSWFENTKQFAFRTAVLYLESHFP